MQTRKINAADAAEAVGGYSQAVEIKDADRVLFISGQIPVRPDGTTPESFLEQARVAWANVEAQLKAADMTLENIVKHTTFLADRKYGEENRQVRREVFGELRPALTVVITGIFDEAWLLEIEAIAAA
jgi:enamine deaminase RidA (YjgF/YER057c/UK114 family)